MDPQKKHVIKEKEQRQKTGYWEKLKQERKYKQEMNASQNEINGLKSTTKLLGSNMELLQSGNLKTIELNWSQFVQQRMNHIIEKANNDLKQKKNIILLEKRIVIKYHNRYLKKK